MKLKFEFYVNAKGKGSKSALVNLNDLSCDIEEELRSYLEDIVLPDLEQSDHEDPEIEWKVTT